MNKKIKEKSGTNKSEKSSSLKGIAFLCACDGFTEIVVANDNGTAKENRDD